MRQIVKAEFRGRERNLGSIFLLNDTINEEFSSLDGPVGGIKVRTLGVMCFGETRGK